LIKSLSKNKNTDGLIDEWQLIEDILSENTGQHPRKTGINNDGTI
jgi:hypothetical protein